MGKHLDEYNEIMRRYRSGELGENGSTLNEILKRAGKPDLMSLLSKKEMIEIRDAATSGFYKKALNDEIIKKWGGQ